MAPKPSVFPTQRSPPRASTASRRREGWTRVSAGETGLSQLLRQHLPSSRGAALSRARHPGKERRTTLPSRPPAVLFPFKSLHVAGGEGGAWTSLSCILFPCVRAGIYFFSFLYSLPLHPPLPPSFPSLPPSLPPLGCVCALGRPSPSATGTRGTRSRSRLSRASSLPSPSLPPPPTPDSGLERRPEEPRGEHPPRPPLSCSHLSLPIDSGTREEGCVTSACV